MPAGINPQKSENLTFGKRRKLNFEVTISNVLVANDEGLGSSSPAGMLIQFIGIKCRDFVH